MPKLVRLYIRHVLIGWAIAAVFCALLIGLDVAGLRHLILHTRDGWIAGIMLFVSNAVVFAGVQFAIAVMRMAEDDEGPKGGRRKPERALPAAMHAVVPVPAQSGADPRARR